MEISKYLIGLISQEHSGLHRKRSWTWCDMLRHQKNTMFLCLTTDPRTSYGVHKVPRLCCIESWIFPDSKVCGTNMGPTWVRRNPDGPMLAQWPLLSGLLSLPPLCHKYVTDYREISILICPYMAWYHNETEVTHVQNWSYVVELTKGHQNLHLLWHSHILMVDADLINI